MRGMASRYVILQASSTLQYIKPSIDKSAMQVKSLSILCTCLAIGLANASPLQKRNGTCQKTKVAIL